MIHPDRHANENEADFPINSPKWDPSLPVISGDVFVECLSQTTPVIVHFFGLWNEFDGIVQERLSNLKLQYCDVLSFIACDISDKSNFAICSRLQIMTVPTVLGVRRGTVISRLDGTMPLEAYDRICRALICQGGPDNP
jgi:thioredoxin-like negative regulator of GroEL